MYREVRRNAKEIVRPNYDKYLAENDIKGIGWIVIMGSGDHTEVKIGFTADLRGNQNSRINNGYFSKDQFAKSSTHFLAAVRGTEQDESDIHTYFKNYNTQRFYPRKQTEYFLAMDPKAPDHAVVDWIAFLRKQYFVAPSQAGMENAWCMRPMQFRVWRPSPDHVYKERHDRNLLNWEDPWSFLPVVNLRTCMDDFFTDDTILECARVALGGVIDLDPASDHIPNEVVKATRYYHPLLGPNQMGGLELPWYGNVWLNPPFSQWKAWSKRIESELDRGEVQKMVVLANTRTVSTQYFKAVMRRATSVCYLHGRYSFWGNEKKGSPSNGQVILYFSPDHDGRDFERAFFKIGTTFHINVENRKALELWSEAK